MNIHTTPGALAGVPESDATATAQIAHQLAVYAAETPDRAIPTEVRLRACHHMLDAAGIALASTRYDFAHKTLAGLRALGEGGSFPVLGMAATLSPRDAATLNGFLCHGLDYDDTHIAGIIHPTASVFPAVMAAAGMTQAGGRAMVTAYVLGVEAAARIAQVAKGGFHQVGFHPTGMVGIFGAALAAGRLLGLNAQQLKNAQGLALSMAAGNMQFLEDGAWNKRFHPGWAAACGLTAASLAREGFVGSDQPYEGRFGLYNAFMGEHRDTADVTLATRGLGESYELLNTAIKPFPVCHFTHGAIDAGIALSDQIDGPDSVRSIEVLVPAETIKTICEPVANKKRPANDYDAKFSTHYLVATALLRARLTLAELEPAALTAPDVLALADKVTYRADPESAFPVAYSGEVIVTLSDGRTLSHREHINRGAANRPLSNDDIVAKFRDNAAMLVNPARAATMEAAMLTLDEAADAGAALRALSL
ncbi:MAG: MmgE/PrpD family protein [Pseudomonadota bacterium]